MAEKEMLEQVYKLISRKRSRWYQAAWGRVLGRINHKPTQNGKKALTECKTAFCVAGTAVAMAGATLYWKPLVDFQWSNERGTWTNKVVGWEFEDCRLPHRKREDVESAAARVLGLTSWQADELFSGTNSMKDIRRCIDAFTKGQ